MAPTSILVVDDAPINLKLIRLLLTHEGYDVRTAERAEEALEMLSSYQPELILADIQLPGMDGLEMTRKVKQDPKTKAIRVVALTGCTRQEDRERAFRAGCEDFITKPIDTTALTARVRDLLTSQNGGVSTEPQAPVPNPEIERLQRRFVTEGAESARKLMDALSKSFDSSVALSLMHKWIGSAAMLGYPAIGEMAGRADTLLRQAVVDKAGLRTIFTDLYFAFAELREAVVAKAPETVFGPAAGKRVALVGFPADRTERLCSTLGRVKALPMLFEHADAVGAQAATNCDVVVFCVREETLESSWLQPAGVILSTKKLMFMGEQRHLTALAPKIRGLASDVVVDRGDADEFLMRLAFVISEPKAAPAPSAAPVVSTAESATRRAERLASQKVVLADDDNLIRMITQGTLQNHGMNCHAADNGLDALRMIRAEQPPLAVLDVNMPEMSGFEVLAAVREEGIPTRIMMLTAFHQEDEVLRAFNLGADDYLTKPFSPFELVARLKRLLRYEVV